MSDGTHRELNWGIGFKQKRKPRPHFDRKPCPVCLRPTSVGGCGFWTHYGFEIGKRCPGSGVKPQDSFRTQGTLENKLKTCMDVLRQIADSKRGGLNKRLALSCIEFIEACDRELAMKA